VSPVRSVLEWLGAAAILAGVVWLGAGRLRQWAGPGAAGPSEVQSTGAAGIPADATEVALLVLLDGTEIKVGDPAAPLAGALEAHATGPARVERGEAGQRTTRAYRHGTTRFFLVSAPTEPGGTPRIVGIYLP
jgi:hypothetical protein